VIEGGLDGYDSTFIVRQDSLENLRERVGQGTACLVST
jgi:hypothetical protein